MLWEELKKIWRPGMLAVLLLLGFVFYTMYLDFYMKYFPNGPQYAGAFQVAEEWVTAYGTTVEPEEIAEIKAGLPALYEEADEYVRAYSRCQKYGLDSYEAFRLFYDKSIDRVSGELSGDQQTRYEDARIIENYLQSKDTNNIYGRIYATNLYLEQYGMEEAHGVDTVTRAYDEGDYTEREYKHVSDRFYGEDAAWRNILPPEVPEASSTYFGYLLIWMVLSVCLLLSPLLVRDRMRSMRSLQWSSRRGRGILGVQLSAAMLSAFLITTVNLLMFGLLFATNGISVFFACRMYSFMFTVFAWPNWTYGTWCAVVIVMCYLVSMGIGALAFFLSRYSGNYVAMLLKLIPLFIAGAFICPRLIVDVFYFRNYFYRGTGIPGIEAMLAIALLLVGAVLCLTACIHQKKQELLDT